MKKETNNNNEKDAQISLLEKWENQMNLIQEKTGVKGIYVILGLFFCVLFVYFNIFDSIITNLVGTLYPAYWTFKSLEQNVIEEQKKWLTYWVVFGSFIIVDMGKPVIVKFIPFYFVLKILFLIWLFMPGSNGCTIIYYLVVKKIFRYYEDKIDTYVDGAKYYAQDVLKDTNLKNFHNRGLYKKKKYNNEDIKEDVKGENEEDKEETKNIDKKTENNKKLHDD